MLVRIVLAMEKPVEQRIRRLIDGRNVLFESVPTPQRLWERLARKSCDVVLGSRGFRPEDPDPNMIRAMRALPDFPYSVLLLKEDSAKERARYLAMGIDTTLSLELSDRQLKSALNGVLRSCRERSERAMKVRTRTAEPSLNDFVSRSPVMRKFMSFATKVAAGDSSLLILGETGVGKERLARAIHAESRRSKGPFVAVNCAAFSEALLESELFGHEEGAFTGAVRAHRGCFELAHGGVIFLDEIGELPNHLQVKLLRVLQEREVTRVGSEQPFHVDVRVMAATHRDPRQEIKATRLREDLYYRLNVVTLTIPPLRDRSQDISDLIDSYLAWLRPRVGRSVDRVSPEALEALIRYAWPGNVRELINVIERAMLLCDEQEIMLNDLPDNIRGWHQAPAADPGEVLATASEAKTLDQPFLAARETAIAEFERRYLTHHLTNCRGRVGEVAQRIGIESRTLFNKMKQYGLRKEDFRR